MPEMKLEVTTIILAGGLGRRMSNENKGLMQHIIINANQNLSEYEHFGYPVITDKYPDFQGPLAGILSCENAVTTELIQTIPCDTPMLPDDLINRMLVAYMNKPAEELCVAYDGDRIQNLFMLFHRAKFIHLAKFFSNEQRKVADWIQSQDYNLVDFSDNKTDFLNINTHKNLTSLQKTLQDQQ